VATVASWSPTARIRFSSAGQGLQRFAKQPPQLPVGALPGFCWRHRWRKVRRWKALLELVQELAGEPLRQLEQIAHDHGAKQGSHRGREPRREPWGLLEMWIADPDGVRICIVEVPEDHPLRRRD
jgi:hypothetical protein